MAESLVESLAADFEPEKYRDEYREEVMELIQKKADGEEFETPEAAAREAEGRRPHGRARGERAAAKEAAVAAPGRRRRRRRRSRPDGSARTRRWHHRSTVDVDGRGRVRLTNLDKVLYPSGFTKAEVDRLLRPHRAVDPAAPRRPVHHVPALPGRHRQGRASSRSAARSTGPSGSRWHSGPGDRGGGIEYCRLEEPAALVWAANLAAIELHAPMALADDLDTPRRWCSTSIPVRRPRSSSAARWRSGCATVLDAVGPGGLVQDLGIEGTPAVRAAEHAGAPTSAPPTSRSPSGQVMERQHARPGHHEMAKAERPGKMFVDWSQNAHHKTTIAPYSLRARPEPTVSTPVTWDEVEQCAAGECDVALRGRRRARACRRARRPLRPRAHARAAPADRVLNSSSSGAATAGASTGHHGRVHGSRRHHLAALAAVGVALCGCSSPMAESEGTAVSKAPVSSSAASTTELFDIADRDPLPFPGYSVTRVTIAPLPGCRFVGRCRRAGTDRVGGIRPGDRPVGARRRVRCGVGRGGDRR